MKKMKSERGALMLITLLVSILGLSVGMYTYNSARSTINTVDSYSNYYDDYDWDDDDYWSDYDWDDDDEDDDDDIPYLTTDLNNTYSPKNKSNTVPQIVVNDYDY